MDSKKKILMISPKDNNFYNFRSELILELLRLGFEVVLVCPYGSKIDYFVNKGCKFINLEIDRRGTSVVNDAKLIFAYRKLIKHEHPALVLTYTTKCSVYGGMVCRLFKIPYIVNNAGLIESDNPNSLLQKVLKHLYKSGFKGAACMMYQNHRERDYINGLLNGRVHYRDIPGSGVNLEQFQYCPYPQSDETIVFNFVARIVQMKGIDEFLECAERIKSKYPHTRFVIYGDYDEDDYRIKVQDYVDKGIVEYAGVKLDMKPFISACHAVIHPSHYEGMTNVVLEHSSMGRPCIGSNIPGVREGIEDGVTGYLFGVKDIDSMVNAVERFINLSHIQKVRMGIAARNKMERQFNREIVTDIYLDEIYRIIGEIK